MTGRYAAAQLYKAKLWAKALAAGVIRPDAAEAELNAYRRANSNAKPRKREKRVYFSGFDAVEDAGIVKLLQKLCDEYGLKLDSKPVTQPTPTADRKSEAAPRELAEAAA